MDEVEMSPTLKNIDEFAKVFIGAVMATNKAANDLPDIEDDYSDQSFDAYRQILSTTGKRLLNITENILRYHGIRGEIFGGNEDMDNDDRFHLVSDANSELFERIGVLLDEAAGIKKEDISLVVMSRTPQQLTSGLKLSRNCTTGSDSERNFSLLTGKNIPKPQLMFRSKVDNSNRPFIPSIKHKFNALKSLEESLDVTFPDDYENDPSFSFPHPYLFELESFVPDKRMFEQAMPEMPCSLDRTPLTLVNDIKSLTKLSADLKSVNEFAVDLEHHSFRSYLGFTCLMQISTRNDDYIVDTLLLRDDLHILNSVFTDPKILKVFHGANSDIEWLQKDFGLYVVNMFDSGQAARLLGFPHFSLAYLLKYYCDIEVNKKHQTADWRMRPLPDEMLKYAREDTHYLLYIYDRMKIDLLHKDNGQTSLLCSVFHNSNRICMKKYERPRFTDLSYEEFYQREMNKRYGKGTRGHPLAKFNSQQMEALKSLYGWRDRMARQHDESTGYVLPNHMMLQLCEILPKEPAGIIAICIPKPPMVQSHIGEIHNMIQKARQSSPVDVELTGPSVDITTVDHLYNFLGSPHDVHYRNKNNSFGLAESVEMFTGFKTLDVSVMDNSFEGIQKKKKPLIFFSDKSNRSKPAKKCLENIVSSFTDSFDKYLPANVLMKKYAADSMKPGLEEDHILWELLPVSVVQPPANQSRPVTEVMKEMSETDNEKNLGISPWIEKIKTEVRRIDEAVDETLATLAIKRKEKQESQSLPATDNSFIPRSYENSDVAKLFGGERTMSGGSNSSQKKKRKDYDPNSEFASPHFKAARCSTQSNKARGNNKVMTYSLQGAATPQIQWPKK